MARLVLRFPSARAADPDADARPERSTCMALQRPHDDRMIGGVCAGIARELGFDVTLVRVGYLLLSILSAAFPGVLVYIILWIVMPEDRP